MSVRSYGLPNDSSDASQQKAIFCQFYSHCCCRQWSQPHFLLSTCRHVACPPAFIPKDSVEFDSSSQMVGFEPAGYFRFDGPRGYFYDNLHKDR